VATRPHAARAPARSPAAAAAAGRRLRWPTLRPPHAKAACVAASGRAGPRAATNGRAGPRCRAPRPLPLRPARGRPLSPAGGSSLPSPPMRSSHRSRAGTPRGALRGGACAAAIRGATRTPRAAAGGSARARRTSGRRCWTRALLAPPRSRRRRAGCRRTARALAGRRTPRAAARRARPARRPWLASGGACWRASGPWRRDTMLGRWAANGVNRAASPGRRDAGLAARGQGRAHVVAAPHPPRLLGSRPAPPPFGACPAACLPSPCRCGQLQLLEALRP
jgi:hypothetical protein